MAALRDVVVVDAVRSAIGKSGRDGMKKNGQLCQASTQELLAAMLRGLVDRVTARCPNFDEADIEDVIVGCLSQIGEQGSNLARFSALLAGLPQSVSACTVNQFCNAGLKSILFAAQGIQTGNGDVMVCAGAEIMSHYGMGSDVTAAMAAGLPVRWTERQEEIGMHVSQGLCAEMISEDEGHTREDLDRFALSSMRSPRSATAGSTTSFPMNTPTKASPGAWTPTK